MQDNISEEENPCVTISACHGADQCHAQLLLNHARSLLQRIPGINIEDLPKPEQLSRLISHVDSNPDLHIHVDLERLMCMFLLIGSSLFSIRFPIPHRTSTACAQNIFSAGELRLHARVAGRGTIQYS
jgi:hypothetical protein